MALASYFLLAQMPSSLPIKTIILWLVDGVLWVGVAYLVVLLIIKAIEMVNSRDKMTHVVSVALCFVALVLVASAAVVATSITGVQITPAGF